MALTEDVKVVGKGWQFLLLERLNDHRGRWVQVIGAELRLWLLGRFCQSFDFKFYDFSIINAKSDLSAEVNVSVQVDLQLRLSYISMYM